MRTSAAPFQIIRYALNGSDISPDFVPGNETDAKIVARVMKFEKTAKAMQEFGRKHHRLSDYGYWFLLGTLWVDYSGWTPLEDWKRFFSSTRPNRATSLMKPSELISLSKMPTALTVYRAHRPVEQDWIAYTLDPVIALNMAIGRKNDWMGQYEIDKADVLALFLRRGENEVLMLDKSKARLIRKHDVPTKSLVSERLGRTDSLCKTLDIALP